MSKSSFVLGAFHAINEAGQTVLPTPNGPDQRHPNEEGTAMAVEASIAQMPIPASAEYHHFYVRGLSVTRWR